MKHICHTVDILFDQGNQLLGTTCNQHSDELKNCTQCPSIRFKNTLLKTVEYFTLTFLRSFVEPLTTCRLLSTAVCECKSLQSNDKMCQLLQPRGLKLWQNVQCSMSLRGFLSRSAICINIRDKLSVEYPPTIYISVSQVQFELFEVAFIYVFFFISVTLAVCTPVVNRFKTGCLLLPTTL